MEKRVHVVATLMVATSVALTAITVNTYRSNRESSMNVYARGVKQQDIHDTARTAVSALQDAVLQAQDYALTGETVYYEAYGSDIREWQDELGTLTLLAGHDTARTSVEELSTAGKRVTDELASIMSLAEKGSRNGALDRIRMGSGIVYLEQARDGLTQIQQADPGAQAAALSILNTGLRSHRWLMAATVTLLALGIAGTGLSIVDARREHRPERRTWQGAGS